MTLLHLLDPMGIDYRVYYESAYMLLHGLNPYYGILSSPFPLNYPPPVFFLIWPLGLFTIEQAAPLWNFSSLFSFLGGIYLILKIIRTKVNPVVFLILSFIFTFPFFPVKFNIGNGQINLFIFFFCVLSFYLYFTKHKLGSALFLAFASSIKLAPLIFLLYFLIKKDYRQIILTVLLMLIIFLLPILILGWGFQQRYYQEIIWYSFNTAAKSWYYNQSLSGFLSRFFVHQTLALILFYALSPTILIITYIRSKNLSNFRILAAVSSLYLLIHPIALQHYFGFAALPLIFLGAEFQTVHKTRLSSWVWLIVAYFLTAVNLKDFASVPKELNLILSHDFYGILILWILSLWEIHASKIITVLFTLVVLLTYFSALICRSNFCF